MEAAGQLLRAQPDQRAPGRRIRKADRAAEQSGRAGLLQREHRHRRRAARLQEPEAVHDPPGGHGGLHEQAGHRDHNGGRRRARLLRPAPGLLPEGAARHGEGRPVFYFYLLRGQGRERGCGLHEPGAVAEGKPQLRGDDPARRHGERRAEGAERSAGSEGLPEQEDERVRRVHEELFQHRRVPPEQPAGRGEAGDPGDGQPGGKAEGTGQAAGEVVRRGRPVQAARPDSGSPARAVQGHRHHDPPLLVPDHRSCGEGGQGQHPAVRLEGRRMAGDVQRADQRPRPGGGLVHRHEADGLQDRPGGPRPEVLPGIFCGHEEGRVHDRGSAAVFLQKVRRLPAH